MERGAGLSLGKHYIGYYSDEPCAECGEPSNHMWKDATFNAGPWFMCNRCGTLAMLQDAETYGGPFFFELLASHGFTYNGAA